MERIAVVVGDAARCPASASSSWIPAVTDLRRLIRLDVPGLTTQVTETIAQLGIPSPVVEPA